MKQFLESVKNFVIRLYMSSPRAADSEQFYHSIYNPARLIADLETENDLFIPLFIAAPVNCCATRHKFSRYPYLHTHLITISNLSPTQPKLKSTWYHPQKLHAFFDETGEGCDDLCHSNTSTVVQKTDVFRAVHITGPAGNLKGV